MKTLHVLYDGNCALCANISNWLARQPAYIELRFVPLQSPEIARRFPGLHKQSLDPGEKLIAISDEGFVYRAASAWIMCLYALRDYREWSRRLAHPALRPFARRFCEWVARHRFTLSRFFVRPAGELRAFFQPSCPRQGGCR